MSKRLKQRETRSDATDQHAAALAAFDREIEQHALQGHWKMELPANMEPRSRLKAMHWKGESHSRAIAARRRSDRRSTKPDGAPSRPGGVRSIIVAAGLLSRSGNRSMAKRRNQWLR